MVLSNGLLLAAKTRGHEIEKNDQSSTNNNMITTTIYQNDSVLYLWKVTLAGVYQHAGTQPAISADVKAPEALSDNYQHEIQQLNTVFYLIPSAKNEYGCFSLPTA